MNQIGWYLFALKISRQLLFLPSFETQFDHEISLRKISIFRLSFLFTKEKFVRNINWLIGYAA